MATRKGSGRFGSINKEMFVMNFKVEYNRVKHELPLPDENKNYNSLMTHVLSNLKISEDPGDYCILYADSKEYVTEENCNIIKDIEVILRKTPEIRAKVFVEKLQTGGDQTRKVVFDLREHVQEVKFVEEFYKNDGIAPLIPIIVSSKERSLSYALIVFADLLEMINKKPEFSVDIPDELVQKVFRCTIPAVLHNELGKTSYLQIAKSAFAVCALLLEGLTIPYEQVEDIISYDAFIEQLGEEDMGVKENVLRLIIALFTSAPSAKKRIVCNEMKQRDIRKTLISITQKTGRYNTKITTQLRMIQHMTVNSYRTRLVKFDPLNTEHKELVNNVKTLMDPESLWHRLGFTDSSEENFKCKNYSYFALEMLSFFFEHYTDSFRKVLTPNASEPTSFLMGEMAILVTEAIVDYFEIDLDRPTKGIDIYYTFMFSSDNPIEEVFCLLLHCSALTWVEMKANHSDMQQVMANVMAKLDLVIHQENREMPSTFDSLRTSVSNTGLDQVKKKFYEDVKKIEKSLWKQTNGPVADLRNQVRKEVTKYVIKHHQLLMIKGFPAKLVNKKGGTEKVTKTVKLAPNKKTIEINPENSDAASVSVIVRDIASVEQTQIDNVNKKERSEPAMSGRVTINMDDQSTHVLIFSTPKAGSIWIDGIKSLMSQAPETNETKEEITLLVDLNLQVQLMNLENTKILNTAPVIPPPPSDYAFCT